MKLTDKDRSTLSRAAELARRFDAGIFPCGAGQHRHFARLVKLGLLEVVGWGRDIDGMTPRDVLVHQLTEAGRTAWAST